MLAPVGTPTARRGADMGGRVLVDEGPVTYRCGVSIDGSARGCQAGGADMVTVEGKTGLLAPSLVQQVREKRSELIISKLETVALALFRGTRVQRGHRRRYCGRSADLGPDVLPVLSCQRRRAAGQDPPSRRGLQSRSGPMSERRAAAALAPCRCRGRGCRGGPRLAGTVDCRRGGYSQCLDDSRRWLTTNRMVAEFFGSRLGLPSDDLAPSMLVAAAGGVCSSGSDPVVPARRGPGGDDFERPADPRGRRRYRPGDQRRRQEPGEQRCRQVLESGKRRG
jgi:hypothetical protein